MLIKEAIWLGEQIDKISLTNKSIVLNFGSQTFKYNKDKEYILDFFIEPLKNKCQIKNLDLQSGPGIDYSGNILDDSFFSKLSSIQFDGVLVCNVLEHVTDIESIVARICRIVKPGGFILFSGPYKYPIHHDPIDNGFRPTIKEVEMLFENFKTVNAAVVKDYTYFDYLRKNPKLLLTSFVRLLLPFYKFKKWKEVFLPRFKWVNRQFQITCVLMKKEK